MITAVTYFDMVPLQNICKFADFAMRLMVGQRSLFSWLSFPDQGSLVSPRTAEMPIKAVLRDVQFSAHKPLSERFLPLKGAFPFLPPSEQFRRLFAPELFRVLNRFTVQYLVLIKTREIGRASCRERV